MITPISQAQAAPPEAPKPKNAGEAAKQFEAMLIAQMIHSSREGMGETEDSTSATALDMADQQFAKLLAENGGLGLATLIVKGLKQDTPAVRSLTVAVR